jgi:Family of unknown function (DUF5313)
MLLLHLDRLPGHNQLAACFARGQWAMEAPMRHQLRHDPFRIDDSARTNHRLHVQRRPNPGQWLWYAVGGRLRPELSQWVLRDTTGRTWWLRHLSRALLQLAPLIAAVVIFLPGPLNLRVSCAILGLLTGLIWAVATMWNTTEHRLLKAGFAPGEAEQARRQRAHAARQQRE